MKYLICNSKSEHFFSKIYDNSIYSNIMKDIREVQYYKCTNFGFTILKTHKEQEQNKFENLNYKFYHYSDAIFIDDSFPERGEVALIHNIPTFSPNMIKVLL